MSAAFLNATQAVSPSALDEWVSGERDSPACVDLLELATAVSPAGLRALIQELPAAGGASWLQGADVKRFLGLIVALLASADAEVTCAAATAFLAALRCLGNGTPGLFDPLAMHELCKSLPAVLCSGDASPAPKKKGRRKQQQDSDEDEEMEDVGAAPPAKAADGLAGELCLFLEAVPLASYPETLSQLVAALVEAAARGAGSRVYLPLTCCLGSEHGELASTARAVLRSLKPSLTLTRETSPNQSAAEAQQACVDFLIRLCKHNADSAEPRRAALQHVVQTLLQHAAVGAPDKAEARALVCNAVCAVLTALPKEEAVRYGSFLLRYSRTSKVGARVFSVEMASTVLLAAAASPSSRRTSLTADGLPQTLWKLLIQRISDKAPGVRTKSLGCVAVLLVKLHAEPGHRLLLQVQMPVPVPVPAAAAMVAASPMMPPPPPAAVQEASNGGGPLGSPLAVVERGGGGGGGASSVVQVEAASSLPTIGALLQQRCVDERPAVRRAALQAIEAWARASGMQVSGSQLKLISRGCSDVSPAIRKQAARSLWAMLQLEPQSTELQAAWTSAILPLATDTEQTVCDACLDTVLEGVLKPLARSKKPRDLAGWPLLLQLPESAMPYLCRAVRLLARQKRLPGGLAPKLQALLAEPPQTGGAGGRPVVWSLLTEMARLPLPELTQQKLDHAAVLRCWELASGGEDAEQAEDAASALQLLVCLSGRSLLTVELAVTLRGQLVERLQRYDASPQLAVLLVQACSSLASPAEREPWAATLLQQCEARLAAGGAALADQRQLRVCAISVGEVALVAPRAVTAPLVASLQALAHGGSSGGGVAPASRAAAFVALGKVCMGNAEVAQRLLPIFMTALTSHEDAAVRSNALVILFDLAKRHTALLERHFSTMALALYDAAAPVRHSALLLFTQLLLEDYVKWRPTLFRAFCVALADVEPAVRASAQVCLFQLLLPRSPLIAFNSFPGLLFQINGCTQHAQHSATLSAAESAALEGIRGEGFTAQRRRLLVFRPLLGCMTGEQKLQTMAKLSQDVLGAVPERQFSLEDIQFVLSDALVLLACKEIKLSANSEGAAGAADEADEGGAANASAAAAAASAHGKLLSQVARKATVEAIVPVVVELKRFLESNHSPLLRDLFLFLRELLRDHKQYLQDILSRDKQLAAEIEYDMKQLDATRNRALQSMSPAAHQSNTRACRSPALGTPRGTPGLPGSKGKATAMRVPTSDQLHALSIPRLRKQRVSGSGLALSVMRAPGTPRSAGASVSVNPPSAYRRRSEGGTPAATVRPDVVMASPR